MDQESRLILDAFKTYKKVMISAYHNKLPNPKNPKASEKTRKKGNALFAEKTHCDELHAEILGHYNKSAALAPSGSQELASAYANRSAFLLHVGKYEECIQDVQKALGITESDELKIKMLCRKVECLKNLGSTCENVLVEAQSLVDKICEDDENKQVLNKMIQKVATKKAGISQETSEPVNLPVTDNVLDKVSIRYNKKYGRHLVAKQNYKPGDIILVEKLFSSSVDFDLRYTNCHHCLKTCWSGIPCVHCDWAIFCSEECSQRAWEAYHDIECVLGQFLNEELKNGWDCCSLSIKILVKALKDAGSIENLRARLEAVDQCTDLRTKGFYKNGKFDNNTIESLYSLTTKNNLEPKAIESITHVTLVTMVGLIKHPLLKNVFSVEKWTDLKHNKDIVFLGSMLIKLIKIQFNNSFSFVHYLSIFDVERGVPESPRGTCMASLVSLINNSCCSNANICFKEDGKAILYALQPVKKNSQIFISYSKEYYFDHWKDRHNTLENYNFECDCEACTEAWPALLYEAKHNVQNIKAGAEGKFMRQNRDLLEAISDEDYSKATFEKLREKISLAFECLQQPSTFTCMMLHALNVCIPNVYDGLKPQTFGICKKMQEH